MIDCQDHWSYLDKSISVYNFLKYSEKEWRRYNPSLHYQNRLRHKDYISVVQKTDFEILEENKIEPTPTELDIIKNLRLSNEYSGYEITDIGIKGPHIVLRK
jgi:hypothetical protein